MSLQEIMFDTRLEEDGHLYCPKEYLIRDAKYKVTVYLPEDNSEEKEVDQVSAFDHSDEYLSPEEINYYLNLAD